MKWFKHDTDATTDAKLKKLILKYGAEGYAVYFHCLELIAGDVSETNITFELEHDAEIIADNLKIKGTQDTSPVDLVNNIMRYIIQLELLQESNGRVFCFKLLKRLDKSMTSNSGFRAMIDKAKSHDKIMINHDAVMIESCKTRLDKTTLDKTRKEKKKEPSGENPPDYPCKDISRPHQYIKDMFIHVSKVYGKQEYYHDAREAKAIKLLEPRIVADEKLFLLHVKKFIDLRKSADKFWNEQPLIPSVFLNLYNRIGQLDTGAKIGDTF